MLVAIGMGAAYKLCARKCGEVSTEQKVIRVPASPPPKAFAAADIDKLPQTAESAFLLEGSKEWIDSSSYSTNDVTQIRELSTPSDAASSAWKEIVTTSSSSTSPSSVDMDGFPLPCLCVDLELEYVDDKFTITFGMAATLTQQKLQRQRPHQWPRPLSQVTVRRNLVPIRKLLESRLQLRLKGYIEYRKPILQFHVPEILESSSVHARLKAFQAFTLIELEDDYFICIEKAESDLQIMLGHGKTFYAYACQYSADEKSRFAESHHPLIAQECESIDSGITIGNLIAWLCGPVAAVWRPYSGIGRRCSFFSNDLQEFLRSRKSSVQASVDFLRIDRTCVLSAVESDPSMLFEASDKLQRDASIVLAALKAIDGKSTESDHAEEKVRKVIFKRLVDDDELLRKVAIVQVMGMVARKGDERATRTVLNYLKDTEPEVRRMAVSSLASIAPYGESAVLAIMAAMQDVDNLVRRGALVALSCTQAGGSNFNDQVAHAALGCLKDKDKLVRLTALEILSTFGKSEDTTTMHAITDCVFNAEVDVRVAGVETLVALTTPGSKAASTALISLLDDNNLQVQLVAVAALSKVAIVGDAAAVVAVADRFRSTDRHVRCAALHAISKVACIGEPIALQNVTPCLQDNEESVRKAALSTLGKIAKKGDGSSIRLACKRIDDSDVDVARTALVTVARLAKKSDDEIVNSIKARLVGYRRDALSAVADVRSLMQSEEESLKQALNAALDKVEQEGAWQPPSPREGKLRKIDDSGWTRAACRRQGK